MRECIYNVVIIITVLKINNKRESNLAIGSIAANWGCEPQGRCWQSYSPILSELPS